MLKSKTNDYVSKIYSNLLTCTIPIVVIPEETIATSVVPAD